MAQTCIFVIRCKNALNNMHRSAVLQAFVGTPLGQVASLWYGKATDHRYWGTRGGLHKVRAARGLDQGCPLSPGLFSAALAPCLDEVLLGLRRLDRRAEV